MTWVLVGYIAKRRAKQVGWVSPWPNSPDFGFPCVPPVEEIRSVSNCIACGYWKPHHPGNDNPLGLYTDPGLAWAEVPEEAQADFALYAYRLGPVQFQDGEEEAINLW
jgi:hypothetical protein